MTTATADIVAAVTDSPPTATWTKLRSGEWGVRVKGKIRDGAEVKAVRKSGQASTVTVAKVVWSGNGVSICAVEVRRAPRRSYGGFGEYCYGICPVGGFKCSPKNGPCHDCE